MRREERILLWSNSVWMFGSGLLGPLYAVFAERVGGDILDISGAWAIYLIVTGILTIVVGRIGDHVGYERIMLAGYFVNIIATFSYLLVSHPIHLFIVQAMHGVAVALADPTWSVLYDRYSTEENDGYIWGSALGYSSIATGIAAFIGGLIVTYVSFAALFVTMSIVQMLGTLVQLRMRNASP